MGLIPKRSASVAADAFAADTATCLGLLAFCAGATIDATRKRNGNPGRGALAHAEKLTVALHLDMRSSWSPTKERYPAKVSKRHILAAVAETTGAAQARAMEGLKKEALIEMAEPILTEARWLPEMLRTPATETGAGPDEEKAAPDEPHSLAAE